MFGEDPIEPIPDRAVIVEVDAAGERDMAPFVIDGSIWARASPVVHFLLLPVGHS